MFDVLQRIKGGSDGATETVYMNCLNVGCCGFEFSWYDTYKVYASRVNGVLQTGDCYATHSIEGSYAEPPYRQVPPCR